MFYVDNKCLPSLQTFGDPYAAGYRRGITLNLLIHVNVHIKGVKTRFSNFYFRAGLL